jgi:hypothetical protein
MNAPDAAAVREWTRDAGRVWWSDVGTDLLSGVRGVTPREPVLAAGQVASKNVAACELFLRRAG